MKIWKAQELQQATGGKIIGDTFWEIKGFSLDSRDILPGSLYIAIKGAVHDGHEHINQALKDGAVAALVERIPSHLNGPVILVPNVVEALAHLGIYQRQHLKGKVIGVTGSAGKTTVKEMLYFLLSSQGKTAATPKSFNTKYGVPVSIAMCDDDTDYAVFEVGMSVAGEIASLVKQIQPHISIITTIAAAHFSEFGSLEKIAEAKAEIFQGMTVDGIAIVNGDLEQTDLLKQLAAGQGIKSILTFGEKPECQSRLIEYMISEDFNDVKASILGQDISFRLQPKGKHWALNAVSALTAIHCAGGDIKKAATEIENFKAVWGRGAEIQLKNDILLVDESYNANLTSMKAALDSFFEKSHNGRRLLVLGSMGGLGTICKETHIELGNILSTYSSDQIFLCGEEMKPTVEALKNVQDALTSSSKIVYDVSVKELMPKILDAIRPGDAVMIKASRFMHLDIIVAAIQQKFGAI